ncbi:MAG: RHS repeat-associated core domain-containing protein, partial [Flavobacterium sp.]
WRTQTDNTKRHYNYYYDALNRMTSAHYGKNDILTHNYNESLSYDRNGNILYLTRYGINDFGDPIPIDDIFYNYKNNNVSNQLMRVSETPYGNAAQGFKDGTNTGDDYAYDNFGNMTSDQNKGITSITYNHLNLPKRISFAGNNSITYIYNALGVKLRKDVVEADTQATTHYMGSFQYNNNTLQYIHTAEGYVRHTPPSNSVDGSSYGAFDYVYNYTDHLGNIRLSYTLDPSDQVLKILEENHYYPFGMKHTYNLFRKDIRTVDAEIDINGNLVNPTLDPSQDPRRVRMVSNTGYQYKYNGKEYQDELGLAMYDYGARNYDPAIGRWMNVDPLAETSRRFNPYTYCLNNPVYFIDPDGMEAVGGGDPVTTVVNSNQISNSFTYDDKGKTIGTDKIQQTVTSTMTVTNADGQVTQTMNTTTMTTAHVDSKGNTTGQATEYSTNSINTKNEDGTWTRTPAIETSKTLDLNETSSEFQTAVQNVQNFKKEEGVSPVQVEARKNESENTGLKTVGGGLGTAGRAIAKYVPHPVAAGVGSTVAGIGAAVGLAPILTNGIRPTNPENLTLRKIIK